MIKVELLDHMGSDLTVVNAARVSFDKESSWEHMGVSSDGYGIPVLREKDQKLIHYLAKHKHISPFGHCFLSFRITAPVFVARQLVKHKFLRWNEVSRRYVDSEPKLYKPGWWRKRAENVKQGSSADLIYNFSNAVDKAYKAAEDAYRELLSDGVAPEQARMILPQSMMTTWIWSGSLDAFVDMCRLRLDPHAQSESQEVAVKISIKIAEHYPISWQALYGEEASTT
jgi:thymidylate synthase (FAD)